MSSSIPSTPINLPNNINTSNPGSLSSTPGFGLPAPVQGTGSFENGQIAKQREQQALRSMSNGSSSSGPQPHPVPNLHGPAPPLQVPNKTPAPARGCSPSRFRSRMSTTADRSATEMTMNNNTNNNFFNSSSSIVPSASVIPTATMPDNHPSPSVRARGPLNSGGHDFVVDSRDARQHSPSGASCPVCGALRLPNIDLRNDASLAVLDKRKAELQRELFKIDHMMMNRRRTQPNVDHNYCNPDSTPSQPTLNRNNSSSSVTAVLQSQPRSHNNSPSRRNLSASAASSVHSTMSHAHASLVNDLRFTADSLLNDNNSGPGGSNISNGGTASRHQSGSQQNHHDVSPSRPRTPRGTHDATSNISRNGKSVRIQNSRNEGSHAAERIMDEANHNNNSKMNNNNNLDNSSTEIAISNIMRGNVNPNMEQYKTFSVSSSSPASRPEAPKSYEEQLSAVENEVRSMMSSSARAGRPKPPASSASSFPSLEQSPLRDEMYSEDHRDTLKELAMLRVEREMRSTE